MINGLPIRIIRNLLIHIILIVALLVSITSDETVFQANGGYCPISTLKGNLIQNIGWDFMVRSQIIR